MCMTWHHQHIIHIVCVTQDLSDFRDLGCLIVFTRWDDGLCTYMYQYLVRYYSFLYHTVPIEIEYYVSSWFPWGAYCIATSPIFYPAPREAQDSFTKCDLLTFWWFCVTTDIICWVDSSLMSSVWLQSAYVSQCCSILGPSIAARCRENLRMLFWRFTDVNCIWLM